MTFQLLVNSGTKLTQVLGLTEDSDEVLFFTDSGEVYCMYHQQDCCEYVRIEDICGDISDLLDATIVHFEERVEYVENDESGTWTFYDIQTDKGCVNIRWLGKSNGYYSESVTFEKLNTRKALLKVLPKKPRPRNSLNLFPEEPKKSVHPDLLQVVLIEPEYETPYFYVTHSQHPDYPVGSKHIYYEDRFLELAVN